MTIQGIQSQVENACESIEKSEKAVHEWKQAFLELASYEIPASLIGKLQRIL
jgi:hypothetical protein